MRSRPATLADTQCEALLRISPRLIDTAGESIGAAETWSRCSVGDSRIPRVVLHLSLCNFRRIVPSINISSR